jgi:protein arginine N-methyltransferase 5
MASQRVLVLGSEENCVPNLPPLLTEVIEDGFDFIAVPLVHPRHRRDTQGVSTNREAAFTRSDLLLPSSSWTRSVVGKLSEWLWPGIESSGRDGEFSASRRNAEDALKQELVSLFLRFGGGSIKLYRSVTSAG